MWQLLLVAEHRADAELVAKLGDALLHASEFPDWVRDNLASLRQWRGVEDNTKYTDSHAIQTLAKRHNIKRHGHFNGEAALDDAKSVGTLFRVWLFLHDGDLRIQHLVFVRDLDGDDRRKAGFTQAVQELPQAWQERVIAAHAQPEIEAWKVAMWRPGDDEDAARRLQLRRQHHGFDPTEQSHRLTSKNPSDKHDVKTTLAVLTEGDESFLDELDLTHVERDASAACGLRPFVQAFRVAARHQLLGEPTV